MSNLAKNLQRGFFSGSKAVADKIEDINRLNVFPVPDGDTGINMSLTLNSVVDELKEIGYNATLKEVCFAITNGSLMGARGNSGVITSQILRGFADYFSKLDSNESLTTKDLSKGFKNAVKVSFNAVRKPVEGTILTVLKETSMHVDKCARQKMPLDEALTSMTQECFAAVARTPEKLQVLKDNGVVDAGAMGFATFLSGFVAGVLEQEELMFDELFEAKDAYQGSHNVEVEQINDWEDANFRYCTEFLLNAYGLDEDETRHYLTTQGDCDLLVGSEPNYKVHVHTDRPDAVLAYMLERGQISEVHIHNMDMQSHERQEKLDSEKNETPKKYGFVAVAVGEGVVDILKSMNVDLIVSGGQTMNPSTKDILDGINKVNAENIIVMPNNKNIYMSAQAAADASDKSVGIVSTTSVLQSFSALFAFDEAATLEDNIEAMNEAISYVHDGEVTAAIKDSSCHDGSPIKTGDIMAIEDGEIEFVGDNIVDVSSDLIVKMVKEFDGTLLTLLAGADLSDEDFQLIQEKIEQEVDDIEIDPHRGEQPLYPLIFALE